MQKTTINQRVVSEYGEILIVRVVNGVKTLTDPCDGDTIIHVPSCRRARLVQFNFGGLLYVCGRDALTTVFHYGCCLGFAAVRRPELRVFLHDLPEGQYVDVLPAAESAAVYAVLRRPVPVLYGAAAAAPIYAQVA